MVCFSDLIVTYPTGLGIEPAAVTDLKRRIYLDIILSDQGMYNSHVQCLLYNL